jgi:hypothetical protein
MLVTRMGVIHCVAFELTERVSIVQTETSSASDMARSTPLMLLLAVASVLVIAGTAAQVCSLAAAPR